ncbi:MAG: tRNA pseudouridine(38-40) synthase TruA [Holophagaceae bacterium]|nr:tRNA pseudouridine(38-40) synthase TruA [Holophagaceae bacterium]
MHFQITELGQNSKDMRIVKIEKYKDGYLCAPRKGLGIPSLIDPRLAKKFWGLWLNNWMLYPYFLWLAYVGTGFHGWQIQSASRSVQGELWLALCKLWEGAPLPQGTGRTDAGVHANAQGVLIWMHKEWEPYRLLAAINAHLPREIRVREVLLAPDGFFPRHHAVAKRYVYKLDEGPSPNPFMEFRRWHVFGLKPIDRAEISDAAGHLIGTHDFSSFRCKECSAETTVRTIFDIRLETNGSGLNIVFEGDRFLMHQVRIIVGTLVEVGRGKYQSESIPRIIESKNRSMAGITAPPEGLYLEKIWYSSEWGIGEPSPWS